MTEQLFDNVWDALEASPVEAANMKARSALMLAIRDVVESWRMTEARAAEKLGVTQPKLNDLLHGQIDSFSVDALMVLAAAAGLTVEWVVKPAA